MKIKLEDLEKLKWGTAVLGSGGGGDPSQEALYVRYLMEQKGSVELISLDDLKENDWIMPVAYMGAPLIGSEKISTLAEFEALFQAVETQVGKVSAIACAEIGGGNGFVPLMMALIKGLPLLDADIVGRAFPELQMSSFFLNKIPCTQAFLADTLGNTLKIVGRDAFEIEEKARQACMEMGSSALLSFYICQKKEALKGFISGSYTRAFSLQDYVVLGEGMIETIDQKIEGGFLRGKVELESGITVHYQNEYLWALKNGKTVGHTPDILMLLEKESKTPICSEKLKYGITAELIKVEAPSIWKTPEGLELVGPKYFGFEI